MKRKRKDKTLSEQAIDKVVVAQVDDDSAWEKPVRVRSARSATIPLSSELAARAAFLARLHRETNVNEWLKRIIRERIDLEEAAFAGLKRELAAKNGSGSNH